MVELNWQEPPSRSKRGQSYESIIEELKKHPGQWALITSELRSSAAPAAFRQAGCEATTRRNKDKAKDGAKTWSVWARYPDSKATPASSPVPTDPSRKEAVNRAIETGTALTPPPETTDPSLNKYLQERRARGASPVRV